MYRIANELVSVALDEFGNLIELSNLAINHNFAGKRTLWILIAQYGMDLEYVISPENIKPQVTVSGDSLIVEYDSIHTDEGILNIGVIITAKLAGEDVLWDIDISNDEEDLTVRECFFPLIGDCQVTDEQSLIWSELGGKKFDRPRDEIASRHTQYMGQDEDGVVMMNLYPGNWLSMNYYLFAGKDHGLYVASHDDSLQQTMHYFRLVDDTQIEAGLVKYPFVKTGSKVKLSGYVVSPYSGAWHNGAKKYRSWFHGTFPTTFDRPKWIGDLNGWQRIIMKHQYGKTLFGYDQMEQIFADGQPADIDGVFLFGWHDQGHDAGYPDYPFDEDQGGREAFKKGISKIQAAGGKVILYFNGHLIEKGADFYNKIGKDICAKNERGLPYTEQYRFSGRGTLQKHFGNRIFVGACPACEQWYEHLIKLCDMAIDLEVDCVFFDQMGGWDNVLCFDESHGHPVPFTTIGKAKADLLERLYKYVKSKNLDMGFGVEILADATAGKVDFVHNLWGGSANEAFINLSRYTMPDITFSDREIRDDKHPIGMANHALAKGLVSDVEIYRCRNTIAETPVYQAYLKQINRLRKKYARLILQGEYRDTEGVACGSEDVSLTRFDAGDETAVILTQHKKDAVTVNFSLPGYALMETDGLGDYEINLKDDQCLVSLKKEALAVCIFKKNN